MLFLWILFWYLVTGACVYAYAIYKSWEVLGFLDWHITKDHIGVCRYPKWLLGWLYWVIKRIKERQIMSKFVLVMNSKTWDGMKEKMLYTAQFAEDPIEHLNRLKDVDIVIDEDLRDDFFEAHNSKEYYEREGNKQVEENTEYVTDGRHVLIDAWGVEFDKLNNIVQVMNAMVNGAFKSGADILGIQQQEFEPNGLTVLLLLSESHFSIHTYPEKGFAGIDCYTCGHKVDPSVAVQELLDYLEPTKISKRVVERGRDYGIKEI